MIKTKFITSTCQICMCKRSLMLRLHMHVGHSIMLRLDMKRKTFIKVFSCCQAGEYLVCEEDRKLASYCKHKI